MTQEDKELLIKDLCSRLPYGVICKVSKGNGHLCSINQTIFGVEYGINIKATEREYFNDTKEIIKPYLRPISSMTEGEMDTLFDILQVDKDGEDEDWIKINDVCGIKFFFPTGKWVEDVADAYDYLYSIHIDFRGLISKGLAIEVTKENNPYIT